MRAGRPAITVPAGLRRRAGPDRRTSELTTVRDNLRHASIATTSIYLHSDDVKRARQLGQVFGGPLKKRIFSYAKLRRK
ncbi:MAG: hypothetical protein EPN65_21215 [Pandoraea sp.]|nr:MAG: hypothetical protein EPN65_21215 [Pandoraea sp.]